MRTLARDTFKSFTTRNFRLFFYGQSLSLIGTWTQQIAMSWLVYRMTGSAFLLGLTAFAGQSIVVEGHADERGSAEYNLGLGDRRATASKEFLVQLGVPGDRLKTISYGRERPQCTEQNEQCNQRNRRAHFAPAQ